MLSWELFWDFEFCWPYFVDILLHMLREIFAAADIRDGIEKMQTAFEIYPYCAMALNYLANHFFFTGQHFLVEQLTETALAVTMHGPRKAHSYYNLARSYHTKVDYLIHVSLYHPCLQTLAWSKVLSLSFCTDLWFLVLVG